MAKVKITQVKSAIKRTQRQHKTLEALGIKKMHNSIEKELTPQVAGMIKAVGHLLKVENI
ncbi:MAG TPA: 50S ribosomal protein L30 [Bacteroidia bacterium]|jgi:large subunit ribosomal protein L30|nr:50S ribosomal protein L30 [Bacteroidia bacterium]